MVSLSKEKKTLQVCFQRHSLGTKHPISYCRRQETIMHIIFLCCWHTEAITVTPSHRPPPVSSSPVTAWRKTPDRINSATSAPQLGFLSPTRHSPRPIIRSEGIIFYFIYFYFIYFLLTFTFCFIF